MKLLVLFAIVFSAFAIEANTDKANKKRSKYKSKSCVPGKLYGGPGCSKCFCNVKRSMLCGSTGTCKKTDKAPKKSELIHAFSRTELYKLPSLPSQGSQCTPGESYRVDCNRCVCQQSKSLMCEDLFCPSYDDINKLRAEKLSGKTCDSIEIDTETCVKCECVNNNVTCTPIRDCVPPEARTRTGKKGHGKGAGNRLKKRKDYGIPTMGINNCYEDIKYYAEYNGRTYKCDCSHNDAINCRDVEYDYLAKNSKKRKVLPFNEAFLDPKSKKKCTPGVLYRRKCNICTCTKKSQVRCTAKECIDRNVAQDFKKRRQKLLGTDYD